MSKNVGETQAERAGESKTHGAKASKPAKITSSKGPSIHQHVGKPAAHVYSKMFRATVPWAPKHEARMARDRRKGLR